jgi:hypothetical protein
MVVDGQKGVAVFTARDVDGWLENRLALSPSIAAIKPGILVGIPAICQ